MPRPLGRKVPTDFKHVDKFPLSALMPAELPVHVPMVLGINWYEEFDNPEQDSTGKWWIAKDGKLTSIRGGHCVCVPDRMDRDLVSWWSFYDQGHEGACVGFGTSRAMSIINRKRYYARWLWDWAKKTDEWTDTNPGDDNGTSVRAAMEILRVNGHVPWLSAYKNDAGYATRDRRTPVAAEGISAYRWATSAGEVGMVLNNPWYERYGGIPILNSWGKDGYPRRVWMTWEVLDRLINEDGEIGVPTDR